NIATPTTTAAVRNWLFFISLVAVGVPFSTRSGLAFFGCSLVVIVLLGVITWATVTFGGITLLVTALPVTLLIVALTVALLSPTIFRLVSSLWCHATYRDLRKIRGLK